MIEELDDPEPGPGELLLRVEACALCGTDRHGYEQGSSVVPGHEIAGVVKTRGAGSDLPLPGTRGVVYLVVFCGVCAACRRGNTNMCLARDGMYGLSRPGGFADYVVVRGECFLPVAPSLSPDEATTLLDLFGTTRHALVRSGPVPSSLAVLGCGPIGLGAIAVARALGISRIYASDVSDYRLDLARSVGAVTIDAHAGDTVEQLRSLEPDGCEVVIEAAGLAVTQRQAIALAAAGGRVMIVAHSRDRLELSTSADLIQREISLIGSEYFPIGEFEDTHALVASGGLDPAPILTHDFPLEDLAGACATFFSGSSGKVVVHP